jgi:hypothetical protein
MGFIGQSTVEIEYTILFQNTGTDTAQTVLIIDQLDSNFNWQTLEPLSSSHPMTIEVDQFGKVTFTFENIMLPDSIVSEPGSHGFVAFKIELIPMPDFGTTITNTAEIYFDSNPPIFTNTKLHTIFNCFDLFDAPFLSANLLCFSDTLTGTISPLLSDVAFTWLLENTLIENGQNLEWVSDISGTLNNK